MLETSPPDARVTLANLLLETRRRLAEAGVETPALDARILVEHFSGTTRTDVISEPDRVVDAATVVAIDDALRRRAAGEPVHRILGFREFYGLHLALSPDTLEPRPDTETLVDAVLAHVEAIAAKEGRCRILDLGTGTGAIALALLSAVPGALATGADISGDALATAARNARDLGLSDRFETLKTDWFREISGRYHVIAANPPYIPSSDIEALQAEVREFDPRRALDGGQDGLAAYRTIAAGAGAYLEAGGIVAVEIGSTQKRDATSLFEQAGFDLMVSRRDFSGNDRVLVFSARERT